VAAIERTLSTLGRLAARAAGLVGGLFAAHPAAAVDVPPNRAEAMFHVYDGGGMSAVGPALLVRKSLADRVSASASYYVDAVSNASIDVVTTASPFKETRTEFGVGLDVAVRDSLITLSMSASREPDYDANTVSLDVSQEVFGGMTTVLFGFSRGSDQVGKKNEPSFLDEARHWQYRVGVTQVLTPRWLASVNLEAVSDDGYLGSPYRAARVFGAFVPERMPRTRSSRAIKLRSITAVGEQASVRAEYRYFWDTWDIKAHTVELGGSRYFRGTTWLADAFVRGYSQSAALFYSDNASTETTYLTRNRQLSAFNSVGVGGRVTYAVASLPARYDVKVAGAYEFKHFNFKEFTDLRNGQPYAHNAHVLQIQVSASF
jgi:hypothetical protein